MLRTHYIYALKYNDKPFYVGISVDPAKRLIDHFGINASPNVYKFVRKIKNRKDVSISILGIVKTKKAAKCKKCVYAEQVWITKYLSEGHQLTNKVIKKYF